MNTLQQDLQNMQGTRLDAIMQIIITLVLLWFGFKWTFGKQTRGKFKELLGAFILVFATANVLRTTNRWKTWENDFLTWLNTMNQTAKG